MIKPATSVQCGHLNYMSDALASKLIEIRKKLGVDKRAVQIEDQGFWQMERHFAKLKIVNMWFGSPTG